MNFRRDRHALLCLIALVLGLLTSCAQDVDRTPELEVRIERVADRGFRVRWSSLSPVKGIVFVRTGAFRSRGWEIETPGAKLERRGDREVIIASKETSLFQAFVPDGAGDSGTDYPLTTSFSNGGVILYTGHLQAATTQCIDGCSAQEMEARAGSARPNRIELVPAMGERVVADAGPAPVGATRTITVGHEGKMAYFGTQAPIRHASFALVADSGMPAWLIPEVEEMLPEILALNERKLNRTLHATPVLFFPFHGGSQRRSSAHSGSVVGNQMIIALYGSRWSRRTPEAREDFLKLLAHESFHFWNASMFHSVDRPGGRWLHEGSADAFAYLALQELGVVTTKRLAGLQSEALNRCLLGMTGTDLPSSDGQSWSIRNHYDCGSVIQHLVHEGVRAKGGDLWKFWEKLFNQAKDGFYTHEAFFGLVNQELGSDSLIVKSLQDITTGGIGGRDEESHALEQFFFKAYKSIGSFLIPSETKWPDWYHRLLSERALSAALEADCGGQGYFVEMSSEGVRLVGGSWCRNLKAENEIDRIGKYSVWNEGVQAYDSIRASCLGMKTLKISKSRDGEEFQLLCPHLPKRPRFVSIPGSDI